MKNLSKVISASVLVFSLIVNIDARFNQQNLQDGVLANLVALTPPGDQQAFMGNSGGAFVRSLLAAAPACDQQDICDNFIDMANIIGKEGDPKTQGKMIDIAKQLRKAERNTPNDGQPSALCDKDPRNEELNGITQDQDPSPNPKKLSAFVPPVPKSSQIPEFKQNGKTVIPPPKDESEQPKDPKNPKDPKEPKKPKKPKEDDEIESLLDKIDTSELSSKDKKTVEKCTKPKSKDRKSCIRKLTKLAKDSPKN